MAQPFLGQIEFFAFDFVPRGWMACAGQIMPIQQFSALFSLLGTTYGGSGQTTFMLPDLRGTLPMGQGAGQGLTPRLMGQSFGSETVALTSASTPAHAHTMAVKSNPDTTQNVFTPAATSVLTLTTGTDSGGGVIPFDIYAPDPSPNQALGSSTIGSTGGAPHSNMMPSLVGNFCIAVQGMYPSRN